MNFTIIDLALLVLFVVFVSAFLYRNKKNLKRDGLLYLYRTSWGMKLIDRTGKKYHKTLGFLSYVSIAVGYLLMAGILWMFGKIIYLYVAYPAIVKSIKIPPVTPLIPYIDKVAPALNLPPFYFIYWIVILAVIAITHEFAHGIFMRRYGIKVKSTGFGFFPFFLPIFLAAFVEQDEESMEKSKIFPQLSVLSAGTFANILTTIIGFVILILFFVLSFAPAGVAFNTYAYNAVNISNINSINGIDITNPTYDNLVELSNLEGYNNITLNGETYLITKDSLENQKDHVDDYLVVYYNSPAVQSNLSGAITEIDGVDTHSFDSLGEELSKYSPGENIEITTTNGNYDLTLGENPYNQEKPWLGIGYVATERKGIVGKLVDWISSFKKPEIYYAPKYEFAEFIYDFLWWLVLISFSVALVNMLPMGIFDGGRFFYLTIFAITKSKKKAERWFKGVTRFLLFLVIVLMVFWVIAFL